MHSPFVPSALRSKAYRGTGDKAAPRHSRNVYAVGERVSLMSKDQAAIPLRTQRIPTNFGHINVHLAGSGPAMVCWPSLLMTGEMWQAQAQHFGANHQMILIDSPGHGGSDPLTRHFTLEECAECLAQILDHLGIGDCILVGNSWGGMMGGIFAALYPQRTRAAVLMNCTASAPGLRQKLEFLLMTFVMRRLRIIPKMFIDRAVTAFAGETTERTKPQVVDYIRATVTAVNPQSVCWAIDSVVPRRVDHRALMGGITSPVLVMTGEEDRTFPVAETRAMADAIPGSSFKVLPKVGHLAALEAPEAVNAAIAEFLNGLPQ